MLEYARWIAITENGWPRAIFLIAGWQGKVVKSEVAVKTEGDSVCGFIAMELHRE